MIRSLCLPSSVHAVAAVSTLCCTCSIRVSNTNWMRFHDSLSASVPFSSNEMRSFWRTIDRELSEVLDPVDAWDAFDSVRLTSDLPPREPAWLEEFEKVFRRLPADLPPSLDGDVIQSTRDLRTIALRHCLIQDRDETPQISRNCDIDLLWEEHKEQANRILGIECENS